MIGIMKPSTELSQEERTKAADPAAVATARELTRLLTNDAVMLFGSRARGDHRPDSDMDLLIVGQARGHQDRVALLQRAGAKAAARVYGDRPAPKVQVVPLQTGRYQREKRSRNFLAGHIAKDAIILAQDPGHWERTPGDHSLEPLYARRAAGAAYEATTILGDWRRQYPEEEDDLVFKAHDAVHCAYRAVASWAGLTIQKGAGIRDLRRMLKATGHRLPAQHTTVEEYTWYERHSYETVPPMLVMPSFTTNVRADVRAILKMAPEIVARERWERWKSVRRGRHVHWSLSGD